MKRLILSVAFALLIATTGVAQSTSPVVPNRSAGDRAQPQLRRIESQEYKDELYRTDDEVFFYRSGFNILLPLTDGAPLRLGLNSSLSTDGMAGVEMTRDLPLRSPIQTRYGQLYSVKDVLVTTNISGHESGFKKQAILVVEPKQLQIDVDSYIQIGEKNGYRVFLKPGKWALKLHCSIQAIENPEGRSWYAKRTSESVVKGEKFGRERKLPSADDPYSGLLYINPYGTVLYGIAQVKGVFGFVFHRPNIMLPATAELNFRIEQVEATYLSRPVPKGPARIVQ